MALLSSAAPPPLSIDATSLSDSNLLIAATFSFPHPRKQRRSRRRSLTKVPIQRAPDLLRRLASLSSRPRSLWNNSK